MVSQVDTLLCGDPPADEGVIARNVAVEMDCSSEASVARVGKTLPAIQHATSNYQEPAKRIVTACILSLRAAAPSGLLMGELFDIAKRVLKDDRAAYERFVHRLDLCDFLQKRCQPEERVRTQIVGCKDGSSSIAGYVRFWIESVDLD